MKLSQVYTYFGGSWPKVASALGLTKPGVYRWEREGYIPYKAQLKIQEATNGDLIASIEDDTRIVARSRALDYKQKRTLIDEPIHCK